MQAEVNNSAGPSLEFMHIGMERRVMGGFERAFIFGDESWESTGQISVRTVLKGISTSRGRSNPHVLCFDEPDIGLSEGYQAALGEALLGYAKSIPEKAVSLIVVTHSRPIARCLLNVGLHCLRVGDDLRPTTRWVEDGAIPRSGADLERLGERARERFRAVTSIIEARKQPRMREPKR